jgi:DNA-binding response OmpR family regulator
MEKNVLIVDDNRDILDLLQIILEMEGYRVSCLDDGSCLTDAILSDVPNLILLDIMLGPLDGRDLCEALNRNPQTSQIPIIMISASHENLTSGGKVCRPDAFISKPFDIDYLTATVARHVS